MKKLIFILSIVLAFIACSKKDETPSPTTTKCSQSTILDSLVSGKQMYLLITSSNRNNADVLLNLKDNKGKARTFFNGILYEYSLVVQSKTQTEITVIGGGATAINGVNTGGLFYAADTYYFTDTNCKITSLTNDVAASPKIPMTYQNLTNSNQLNAILVKYEFK